MYTSSHNIVQYTVVYVPQLKIVIRLLHNPHRLHRYPTIVRNTPSSCSPSTLATSLAHSTPVSSFAAVIPCSVTLPPSPDCRRRKYRLFSFMAMKGRSSLAPAIYSAAQSSSTAPAVVFVPVQKSYNLQKNLIWLG